MDSCTTELPLRVNGIQPAFGIELGQAGPRTDEGRADPYRQANVSYSLVKRRQAAVVRHTLIAGEERLPLAIGGLCGAE